MPPKKIKKATPKVAFFFLNPPIICTRFPNFFTPPSHSSSTRISKTAHLLATLDSLEPLKPHTS